MTAQATPLHRVSTATAQMRAAADAVADDSVWSMDEHDTAHTLVELTRLEAQVAELKARVAAHADDLHLGRDAGASSAANWLAHTTRTTRSAAHGIVRLGHSLDAHPLTRDTLAAGRVGLDQARAILTAIDDLPGDVDSDLAHQAEQHLLDLAGEHDSKALTQLGKHLYEVIAPDQADAREAAILAAEERAAARSTYFKMWDDGHGKTHGQFVLPTLQAAALRKALAAITAPKHQRATRGAGIERLPTPEAMGHAFGEYVLRYPVAKLPNTGGLNASLVVFLDEGTLTGRLEKAGYLDTGERISPGLVRRLACEAGIIPLVLGSDSQPLDIGRERFHNRHQRLALLARDQHCRAAGCDTSVSLHTHHRTPYAHGGATTIANAITLCPWHHHRAHDPTYTTTYHPNGDVTFHRRT